MVPGCTFKSYGSSASKMQPDNTWRFDPAGNSATNLWEMPRPAQSTATASFCHAREQCSLRLALEGIARRRELSIIRACLYMVTRGDTNHLPTACGLCSLTHYTRRADANKTRLGGVAESRPTQPRAGVF